ncbi:hypothetical protein NEOKW01_0572 [Nematocida sp. AWRm80]|nr:hypothetical protein NEOKW01_0572 [Nematocida sp. AWRm80]
MERKKKTHWSNKMYLKRINSTEVLVKRSIRRESTRINTIPIVIPSTNTNRIEKSARTPNRIIQTPIKRLICLTPNKDISIPCTPYTSTESPLYSINRSKKRLFY